MKKIVAVLLVLALVSGVAFADPKISLNFRAKSNAFQWIDGNVTLFNGKDDLYKGLSDSTKLSIADENYGAELAFNLDGTGALVNNTYNGWLAFGSLKLGAGVWKDGLLDGNYRVKKDADAGSYEGVDFEAAKLGAYFGGIAINFVDDMVSIPGGKGNEEGFAAYAEYKAKLNDDLQLNVMLSGIDVGAKEKGWTSKTNDERKITKLVPQGAARVQFNVKGILNSEVIYKTPNKGTNALALYVQPKMVKGLDATIGGAFQFGDIDFGGTKNAWGVDVRARYQVTKALSITEYFNISGADDALSIARALADTGSKYKTKNVLWNMIGARYIINDAVTAYTNVGLVANLDKDVKEELQWRVTPGVQIYAAKNAFINVGVALSGVANTEDSFALDVPVIFRVKL